MIYIYTLSSSESPSDIRYVGKTKNIKDRIRRHTGKYHLNTEVTYKNNWVKSELSKGNKILMQEIDVVDDLNWEFWEQYWIEQFKSWGFRLTNTTKGGDGLILTDEIINKRNATRIKNTTIKKREEIEKFNVYESNNVWFGERICPSCHKKVKHKSKSIAKIVNLLKKSINRNCYSCTRFICNKDKGNKNFGDVGKRYGKKILQYDVSGMLLNEFNSIHEASRLLKINRKSISNCIKGTKWYGTAGGYIFKIKTN
jgi:hypothetical protein